MHTCLIILYLIFLSIPVAIVGFVYSYMLTQPGMIFSKVYDIAERKLPKWLFMPLIGCYKCVSGQLALWFFPFFICPLLHIRYNFFLHIFFIAVTIYAVYFVAYFYTKAENDKLISEEEPKVLKIKNNS